MPNIIATLTIDQTGVLLDLRADGEALLSQPRALEPGDAVTLADALGTVTGDNDVRDVIRGLLAPIADQLERDVASTEAELSHKRERLEQFQNALGGNR